jgi:hypothetical protein
MAVPDPQVREKLMEQFHQANQHFRLSRQEWEKWLALPEFDYEEHVSAAREKLREAEREVEAVEDRIRQAMSQPN